VLATDKKKLRFLGMDMQSRVRRRWAVAGMYVAYYAAMGWCKEGHGWLAPEKGMWAVSIAMVVFGLFRENGLVKSFGEHPFADLDEREVLERNKASSWALNIVVAMLAASAVGSFPVSRVQMVKSFLTLAVLGFTLPKAFLLWREPDPQADGKPELVRSAVS
jgi:hypothetical protein